MIVDVFELARTNGRVDGRVAIGDMARLRTELSEVSGAVDFRFEAHSDAQGRPAAVLRLSGKLPLTCDRCGQPVSIPLDRSSSFFFVNDEAELAALPVSVDDEPEPLLGTAQFDLAELVEDEAILAVPLSPRHEKCPGKRPDAGPPFRGEVPNPFAALEGLLRKNG